MLETQWGYIKYWRQQIRPKWEIFSNKQKYGYKMGLRMSWHNFDGEFF